MFVFQKYFKKCYKYIAQNYILNELEDTEVRDNMCNQYCLLVTYLEIHWPRKPTGPLHFCQPDNFFIILNMHRREIVKLTYTNTCIPTYTKLFSAIIMVKFMISTFSKVMR